MSKSDLHQIIADILSESTASSPETLPEAPISPGGYWSNLPPEQDAPAAAAAPSIAPLQSKLARSGAVIGVFKGHLVVMTPVPNSAKGVNLEQLLAGQASVTARNNMRTACAWFNARLAKIVPNFDPNSEMALQPDVMCDVLPADATSAAKSTDGLMLAWTTDRSMQSARQRKVEQMIIQQYKLPTLA